MKGSKTRNSAISSEKILVITGQSAKHLVQRTIPNNLTMKVLPIDVAAFITERLLLEHITKEEAKLYDLIIVPGLVLGDLSEVAKELGIPVVKGPKQGKIAVYPTIVNLNKNRKIKFVSIEQKNNETIKIYTLRGNLVKEINNANFTSGVYEWDVDDLELFSAIILSL